MKEALQTYWMQYCKSAVSSKVTTILLVLMKVCRRRVAWASCPVDPLR